jgi:hypothetical protein
MWLAIVLATCNPSFAIEKVKARPNLWGVWMGLNNAPGADPRYLAAPYTPTPEFTPWGAAESKRMASPLTPGRCDIWNPVMFMDASALFPIQILDGPNQIVILHEAVMQPRRIYMDGRGHPPDYDPTFLGHSTGHWEGDTLVVDTVGTNGRSRPMNSYVSGAVGDGVVTTPRLPASDQQHIVERIRLVGGGDYLEDVFTVEDPKTYLKPFTGKRYWQRRPDIDVQEYVCADNLRLDAEGQVQAEAR